MRYIYIKNDVYNFHAAFNKEIKISLSLLLIQVP